MQFFPKNLLQLLLRAWRGFSAIGCLFYQEGRSSLLLRNMARTELEILNVEQKRLEIEFQRANGMIDLAQKVEKIKDPLLRGRLKTAFPSDAASLEQIRNLNN